MPKPQMPKDLKTLYERVRNSHREMGWLWTLPLFERIARLEAQVARRDQEWDQALRTAGERQGATLLGKKLGYDARAILGIHAPARAAEPKGEALPYGGGYMTEEEYKRPGGFGDLKADLKEAENG